MGSHEKNFLNQLQYDELSAKWQTSFDTYGNHIKRGELMKTITSGYHLGRLTYELAAQECYTYRGPNLSDKFVRFRANQLTIMGPMTPLSVITAGLFASTLNKILSSVEKNSVS